MTNEIKSVVEMLSLQHDSYVDTAINYTSGNS